MNQQFLMTFGLAVILCICLLPFERNPKYKKYRKTYVAIIIVGVAIFASLTMYLAWRNNPKVHAALSTNYIEFKKGEKFAYDDIDSIKYYKDVQVDVIPNGYRWGSEQYYSGDANIDLINSKGKKVESIFKAKAYLDSKSDSYIVLTVKDPYKTYVFNLSSNQKTEDMYNTLKSK